MSQTHGDLSGARPTQEYSACEHSLTHITLGAGASVHQYPTQQLNTHQHYQQQQHPRQLKYADGSTQGTGTGLQQLPVGTSVTFGGRSTFDSSYLEPPFAGAPAASSEPKGQPQDLFAPPQVYDNSMLLKEQGDHEDNILDDQEEREGGDFDDGGDGNSQGSGKRSRTRRPHLQGRFSGRLTTKEDERRLAEECKLLGPLLGGVGKRGDKSRLTLAKIVRGIATGDVRRFCEERERAIGMLKAKLAAIDPEAAASVPVNPIAIPSAGGLGGLGVGMGMSMGSGSLGANPSGLGLGLGLGGHSRQVDVLQRENSDLQSEVYNLRMELQARERLLLELQDTGIISGFVPTSIPMDEPSRLLPHQSAPLSGAAGGGGGRSHSADVPAGAPPYGLPPRHQSYAPQHVGSFGGPSQMSMPQSSVHVSSGMEPGPINGGAMALGAGLGQQPGAGMQGGGGGGNAPLGNDASSMGAMPAMSEHSRAGGRPLKRPAIPDLVVGGGGGGVGGGGGYAAAVPRSLSHPPLGRSGGNTLIPHIDLQQQLNSLQAQVEQLQNLSQGQGSGRSAASYLMPARERSGLQLRMGGGGGGGAGGGGGGQMQFGAGSMAASPFVSSHSGPQGGLLMLPGHQSESGGHTFHGHPGIGAPLQLQVVKPGSLYDDVGGGVGARDPRDTVAVGVRHGGSDADAYGGGVGATLDATLEHMINSRAMRGEYDLPLELLLPEAAGKAGGSGPH